MSARARSTPLQLSFFACTCYCIGSHAKMQEGKLKKFLPGFVQIARKRRNLLGDVPSELAGGGKNETIFGHSGGVFAADGLRSEPGGRDDLRAGAKRTAAGAGRKAEAAKASDVSFQFNICRRKKCVLPAGKGLAIYEI